MVEINLADDSPEPVAKPEEGEFIEKHLVPLKNLMQSLTGEYV
jgi:ADP-ribose pyrophosphatase